MASETNKAELALQGACSVIRGLLAGVERDEVLTRHRIGEALRKIKGARELYGGLGIDRVATELGVSKRYLYQHISVAEHWEEAVLKAQLEKTNRFGQPLSWSHLLALTAVSDAAARARLAEESLGNAWSVRELAEHIELRLAGGEMAHRSDSSGSRGRSSDAARAGGAVRAALKEGIDSGGRAVSEVRLFEETLGERLADADDPVDAELVARALQTFGELQARAESAITRLRGASDTASQRRVRVAREIVLPRETEEHAEEAEDTPAATRALRPKRGS